MTAADQGQERPPFDLQQGPRRDRPVEKDKEKEDVDPVDEAGDESFPASDPPSWTPTHVGEGEDDEDDEDEKKK